MGHRQVLFLGINIIALSLLLAFGLFTMNAEQRHIDETIEKLTDELKTHHHRQYFLHNIFKSVPILRDLTSTPDPLPIPSKPISLWFYVPVYGRFVRRTMSLENLRVLEKLHSDVFGEKTSNLNMFLNTLETIILISILWVEMRGLWITSTSVSRTYLSSLFTEPRPLPTGEKPPRTLLVRRPRLAIPCKTSRLKIARTQKKVKKVMKKVTKEDLPEKVTEMPQFVQGGLSEVNEVKEREKLEPSPEPEEKPSILCHRCRFRYTWTYIMAETERLTKWQEKYIGEVWGGDQGFFKCRACGAGINCYNLNKIRGELNGAFPPVVSSPTFELTPRQTERLKWPKNKWAYATH